MIVKCTHGLQGILLIKHFVICTCYCCCCCCVCAVVLFSFVRCISTFKVQFAPFSCGCVRVCVSVVACKICSCLQHTPNTPQPNTHTHSAQRELPLPLRLHANLLLVTNKPTLAKWPSWTAGLQDNWPTSQLANWRPLSFLLP